MRMGMEMKMGVEVASLPAQCQRSQAHRQLLRYLHLQQCKEFTMLVTELIISYATYPPLSLSLFPSYMPCVSVSGSSCLPRGLAATAHSRAGQAKANQDRPAGSRRQFQLRRLWHILVMCFSCPCSCPCPWPCLPPQTLSNLRFPASQQTLIVSY